MKTKKILSLLVCSALCLSMAACSDSENSKTEKTDTGSSQSSVQSGDSDKITYNFDRTIGNVEVGGKKYQTYINKPIRFNFEEIPYEEWLAYESPFDEYIELYYDDGSGLFNIEQTTAFALRYAYENDIEYLDLPFEYSDMTIEQGWHYLSLSFPNVPDAIAMSTSEYTSDGYTRIKLSDSVRKCASASETIEAAKEIIASMPDELTTDAEKAYYLYDWICTNVGYDSYHAENNVGIVNAAPQSAYGALVDRRAVCDGIAGGLQLLFNMAGIDCAKIDANENDSDGGHVWNVAEIDGEVWDFDATWDICNYYESEGDELTETEPYYFYEWFGVSRNAKAGYSISDVCNKLAPATQSVITEKSPCTLIYDYVISFDMENATAMVYGKDGTVSENAGEYVLDKLSQMKKGDKLCIKMSDGIEALAAKFCSLDPIAEGYSNYELITYLNPTVGDMVVEVQEE